MYIGICFHLYIFFAMFCVHSFFVFVFLFIVHSWSPTVVSQHLTKSDKRGWLTRWPPRSFSKLVWHSIPLCLHWSAIVPQKHIVICPLTLPLNLRCAWWLRHALFMLSWLLTCLSSPDTSDRSVSFETYTLNSTETNPWTQMPAGVDFHVWTHIFFSFGSTATCVFWQWSSC